MLFDGNNASDDAGDRPEMRGGGTESPFPVAGMRADKRRNPYPFPGSRSLYMG